MVTRSKQEPGKFLAGKGLEGEQEAQEESWEELSTEDSAAPAISRSLFFSLSLFSARAAMLLIVSLFK